MIQTNFVVLLWYEFTQKIKTSFSINNINTCYVSNLFIDCNNNIG